MSIPTFDELPDLLTVDEAAAYLRVAPRPVRRALLAEQLRLRIRNKWRIPKRRLAEWLTPPRPGAEQ